MKAMTISQRKKAENRAGYLFAGPWILGIIFFGAFPFLASLYLSFTNYNMLSTPNFIGLTNYRILFFNDSIFWLSLGNTVYHVLIAVPLGIVLGLLIALLLNNKIKGMSVYRTMFFLPNVVSIVALSLLWLWLFQPSLGLINELLDPVYRLLDMEPLRWHQAAETSKITLILMGLWTVGGSMIIYLAQMQDIPLSLYESAEIDGAGWLKKTRYITLPLMTPSIFFNFIIGIIGSFQVFTLAYIVTGGGPSRSTYYFAYYLFDKMINDQNMGMASAMAWVLLAIVLVITMAGLKLNKYVIYLGDDA
jgi:multiple sugar transport system permease protein